LSTVSVEFHNIVQTLNATATTQTPEAIEAAGLENQLKHEDFLPVLRETKDILDMLMPFNSAKNKLSLLHIISVMISYGLKLLCLIVQHPQQCG